MKKPKPHQRPKTWKNEGQQEAGRGARSRSMTHVQDRQSIGLQSLGRNRRLNLLRPKADKNRPTNVHLPGGHPRKTGWYTRQSPGEKHGPWELKDLEEAETPRVEEEERTGMEGWVRDPLIVALAGS